MLFLANWFVVKFPEPYVLNLQYTLKWFSIPDLVEIKAWVRVIKNISMHSLSIRDEITRDTKHFPKIILPI